jgi:integral membrane sensor domain MASE1
VPFALISLVVTAAIVVAAFLKTSPRVANTRALLAFNVAVLGSALAVAATVGLWLHADAMTVKADERFMAAYLAVVGGVAMALILVAVGGLVRNFLLFPRSKRLPPPATPG